MSRGKHTRANPRVVDSQVVPNATVDSIPVASDELPEPPRWFKVALGCLLAVGFAMLLGWNVWFWILRPVLG